MPEPDPHPHPQPPVTVPPPPDAASVVLQVSDPHFGTERPEVVDALLRLSAAHRPRLLVLSGDITQRARRWQFDAARAFVDRVGAAAVLAVPGNHDIPLFDVLKRIVAPYSNYSRAFGGELEPVFESADLLVVGVNTTRPYRHKHGEVSSRQVQRIAQRLERATDRQLRIVVTHQPVHVTEPEDRVNLLRGHPEAIRAWAAAGADLILGGHIHLPFVRQLSGAVAHLPRRTWSVQAGTAVSWRIRRGAPNSVWLVRSGGAAQPRRCVLERWDYDDDGGDFALVEQTALTLDRSGAGAVSPDVSRTR